MDEDEERRIRKACFLTTYNKDYTKRKFKKIEPCYAEQEFKDPISVGFQLYLEVDEPNLTSPVEDGDKYLKEFKETHEKIGKMYFETPLDHITIKGTKILEGRPVYQVDYCDIEAEIRRKLMEEAKEKPKLPEGWVIPITTQTCDFRNPAILTKHRPKPPLALRPIDNLTENENINEILNVRTGDSEYNGTIGKWGEFIVKNQMHGKIDHPKCSCLEHNLNLK